MTSPRRDACGAGRNRTAGARQGLAESAEIRGGINSYFAAVLQDQLGRWPVGVGARTTPRAQLVACPACREASEESGHGSLLTRP